jgi:REP-associated tyrosine transposase
VPDAPHHIVQRGNNRQDVFFVDDDRHAYLALLKQRSEAYGLEIVGYCLMTNHVHLIAIPHTEDALAKAIGRTHYLYTQYINRLHGRSGHLWQNRFHSCPMDDVHLWRAMSYIERNPVRAKMVRAPWRYSWSSASAHCGGEDASALLDLHAWNKQWRGDSWKTELRHPEDVTMVRQIQQCIRTGRPLASDKFVSKLETALGRRVRPLPVGRPRKKTAEKPPLRRKRAKKR